MLNSVSLQSNSINAQLKSNPVIKNTIQTFTSTTPTKSLQSPSIENLKANFLTFTSKEPKLTPEEQARKAEVDAQIREYIMNDEPFSGTHTDVQTKPKIETLNLKERSDDKGAEIETLNLKTKK